MPASENLPYKKRKENRQSQEVRIRNHYIFSFLSYLSENLIFGSMSSFTNMQSYFGLKTISNSISCWKILNKLEVKLYLFVFIGKCLLCPCSGS